MRTWTWCVFLACWVLGAPALGVTVEEVPRLAAGSWSVDMTRTLAPQTLAEVDQLGNALVHDGKGQLVVVVVDTTGRREPRDFALALFNQWGIGKAGRDDGVLLFVALKDRAAEIILGDGVDGPADQAMSDDIMATGVVPAFKRGSPDDAVLEGARRLHSLVVTTELNQPPAADAEDPHWYNPVHEAAYTDAFDLPVFGEVPPESEGGFNVAALAGSLGFVGALCIAGRVLFRRLPRWCQRCRNPRTRLDEESEDTHLDPGQLREEQLGSVDYDVWWCEPCENAVVERYGTLFTRHVRCGKCRYVTANKTSRTLRSATYSHGGELEVTVRCKHCEHTSKSRHKTPKLTRSTSSSSSSSSRSSSSGGGRSSGGGSSGRW
ncbi:TPM domain-containing protein [Myxococcus sp. 1LA]